MFKIIFTIIREVNVLGLHNRDIVNDKLITTRIKEATR